MNQQYLFYTKYYSALVDKKIQCEDDIDTINKQIINATYSNAGGTIMPFSAEGTEDIKGWKTHCFEMKVCYPGLLAGLGYAHEAGNASPDKTKEIKLGFSLDYVSGLPYIPGSTLKGVLRSVFRKYDVDVGHLLSCSTDVIHALEEAIFENGQDIFLDVFPVSGDSEKRLLGLEYITSHLADNREYDGLTKINPLRLLKIRPDVKILFRFLLQDTCVVVGEDCFELTAVVKKELFEIILERYGFGAKTNTGYGHVARCDVEHHEGEKEFRWLVKE